MAKGLLMFFFACLFTTAAHGSHVAGMWDDKEMDPRRGPPAAILKIDNVNLLPADIPAPRDLSCDASRPCTFKLHYFKGQRFDLNDSTKKNILFISGGPGEFVEEGKAGNVALAAFDGEGRIRGTLIPEVNGKHNIVYFHVRGAGQSIIDGDNKFDQFLRGKYVVEDIEKLRQHVLGDKPWDSIYAHSWGTVVAQLYAKKYGRPDISSGRAEPGVKSLILSAPIVRKRSETPKARIEKAVTNLKKIYQFYRPKGRCIISDASYLRGRVDDFEVNFIPEVSGVEDLSETDNLCFISVSRILDITRQVKVILTDLDRDYGSLNFVTDKKSFDTLQGDPKFPTSLKRFPRDFYVALRTLQMLGAPEHKALVFTQETKNMIDMALVIGYHLTPRVSQELRDPCDSDGRFLTGAAARPDIKAKYCIRLKRTKVQLLEIDPEFQSERAREVFAVYDGVARWVFSALNKKRCFSGQDLKNFANADTGPADRKKLLRDAAKKIGIDESATLVCGWDPGGENAHGVPTLILAGSADAIIAGCQAEDFYNDGLTGQKVFLEFPGMGHAMTVANAREGLLPLDQTQTLSDLIEKFITMSASEFGSFVASEPPELKVLKAKVRQPVNGSIACRR
jgi:pimeloyl-ACP methyl ester carboxylesterase